MPRSPYSLIAVFVFSIAMVAFSPTADAGWGVNGVPLSPVPYSQTTPQAVSDGAGGMIVAYAQFGTSYDVYAQRIDARGNPMWGPAGVAVCANNEYQYSVIIASDGAGGAIIAWHDLRNGVYDIYVQRVDATGTPLWTPDGVRVTFDAYTHWLPQMVADGFGGAVIVWEEYRFGNADIFAQRFDANGTNLWLLGGVPACYANNDQLNPVVTTDGAGGAIVAWEDFRGGASYDVYAQRLAGNGVAQWTAHGRPVCTSPGNQLDLDITIDGAGGAVIAWEDDRVGNKNIYAQRLDASGSPQWAVNGQSLCSAANSQEDPELIPDGTGGAIVAWEDPRVLPYDIYAQRINGLGLPMWTADGVLVCGATNNQIDPFLVPDGEDGAVIVWTDARSDNGNIYAQRLSGAGDALWAYNGKAVCTASGSQNSARPVASTDGGFFAAWYDFRSDYPIIYAQRFERKYGEWGFPEPQIDSVADVPADQGGFVNVNWLASGRDNLNQQLVGYYTVWRAIDQSAVSAATSGANASGRLVDLSKQSAKDLDHNAYFVEHTAAGSYFWQWVGQQTATYSPAYSFSAATQFDSVSVNPGIHYFRVIAHHAWDQFTFWESTADSGYSVDNVAPGSPFLLSAMRAGGSIVDLDWSPSALAEADFKEYHVYRGTLAGFPVDPAHFLATADDTVTTDDSADPTVAYYYKVVSVDVHENESPPSNEAMVNATSTGVGTDAPALTALQVLPNVPNPFGISTELRIGLPEAADISLEVYDVAGRRVYSERRAGAGAGWQSIPFAGRDARGELLPSGVYFYRVRAAGQATTRKMVIQR